MNLLILIKMFYCYNTYKILNDLKVIIDVQNNYCNNKYGEFIKNN